MDADYFEQESLLEFQMFNRNVYSIARERSSQICLALFVCLRGSNETAVMAHLSTY